MLLDCAALKERCPPRQRSRVERLKEKVKPVLTSVTVKNQHGHQEFPSMTVLCNSDLNSETEGETVV